MAKDGTARGGARIGNGGQNKKPLAERILEGKAQRSVRVEAEEPKATKCPPVKDFLKAAQVAGVELHAEEVYKETWKFLVQCGCERKISPQLLDLYCMNIARWRQCEEMVSKYGLLMPHPTTGVDMASPYVSMSREYSKQANAAWYQISAIIRDNSEVYVDTAKQQNDTMELLLAGGKKSTA